MAGDKLPVKIQNDWDLERAVNSYELSTTLPKSGEHIIWSKGFYAWNAATEQATLYAFGVNGNLNTTAFRRDGDTWVTQGTVLSREGEKKTHSSTIEVKDAGNTHTRFRVIDGEAKARMVWKR
jgi:hypothetical protein